MRTTNHGRDRMLERGISPDDVLDTIQHGRRINCPYKKAVYFGKKTPQGMCVVVSGEDGSLVTTYVKKRKKKKVSATGEEHKRKNSVKRLRIQMKLDEIKQELNEGM